MYKYIFVFIHIVDTCVVTDLASVLQSSPEVALLTAPLVMAMSYGIARSTAAGFGELKNAIFSEVANGAIRKVWHETILTDPWEV